MVEVDVIVKVRCRSLPSTLTRESEKTRFYSAVRAIDLLCSNDVAKSDFGFEPRSALLAQRSVRMGKSYALHALL